VSKSPTLGPPSPLAPFVVAGPFVWLVDLVAIGALVALLALLVSLIA
jgi:hypothetical protein